jgi:translation initiation factor IF-2
MSHKKPGKTERKPRPAPAPVSRTDSSRGRLELVLKCGADGSREAVEQALAEASWPGQAPVVIHSGVGEVNKSDVLLAESATRLVIGFEVGVTPLLDEVLRKSGVEVRLYRVIYRMVADHRPGQGHRLVQEQPSRDHSGLCGQFGALEPG